ncbi:MAG: hypothetical protein V4525_01575 [Pseudomonadota bacterium]
MSDKKKYLFVMILSLVSISFAAPENAFNSINSAVNQPPENAPAMLLTPSVMTQCEYGVCSTWRFEKNGKSGTAEWQNGANGSLTVDRFDYDQIIIRRADGQGVSQGLSAIYIGKVSGNRIDGTVTWYWPGHWDNGSKAGVWYASFTPLRMIQNDKTVVKSSQAAQSSATQSQPATTLPATTRNCPA